MQVTAVGLRPGYELDTRPRITLHRVDSPRGRRYEVPDRLPQLPAEQALATVQLPLQLNRSDPGQTYRMIDRTDRARVYEAVLREGTAEDVLAYVDGTLLIDLWPELVLPPRPVATTHAYSAIGRVQSSC